MSWDDDHSVLFSSWNDHDDDKSLSPSPDYHSSRSLAWTSQIMSLASFSATYSDGVDVPVLSTKNDAMELDHTDIGIFKSVTSIFPHHYLLFGTCWCVRCHITDFHKWLVDSWRYIIIWFINYVIIYALVINLGIDLQLFSLFQVVVCLCVLVVDCRSLPGVSSPCCYRLLTHPSFMTHLSSSTFFMGNGSACISLLVCHDTARMKSWVMERELQWNQIRTRRHDEELRELSNWDGQDCIK